MKPVDPKDIPDKLPEGIPNDSGMPWGDAAKLLREGGVDLAYGDMHLVVHRDMLLVPRAAAHRMGHEERLRAMLLLEEMLPPIMRRLATGLATDEEYDLGCDALLMWTALRELAS
jgi:hypothetical protein